MQTLFNILITLQFLAVVFHDFLDIPGWHYGSRVQAVVGKRKFLLATAINALFPGLAFAFALYFWNNPAPNGVRDYWIIYCAITLASAIAMWYIPYFFGTSQKTTRMYLEMYKGTHHLLPARGDNPRPNILHLLFHLLFITTLLLALTLRLQ